MNAMPFEFKRNALYQWVFTSASGPSFVGCTVVRAFALSAPHEHIAIVNAQGQEVGFIENLNALPGPLQLAVQTALTERELKPQILQIHSVSTFSTPSEWAIKTDRGLFTLKLDNEEAIRRLNGHELLITDAQGLPFSIPDKRLLDRRSRQLLERFLS
jgi:hypothetical protein